MIDFKVHGIYKVAVKVRAATPQDAIGIAVECMDLAGKWECKEFGMDARGDHFCVAQRVEKHSLFGNDPIIPCNCCKIRENCPGTNEEAIIFCTSNAATFRCFQKDGTHASENMLIKIIGAMVQRKMDASLTLDDIERMFWS